MYLDFYGLKEKPFSLTPDPQFLFLSQSHRTAIEYLIYGIEQREGFIVITGEIGTGKTTLCRALLERLDKKIKTAVIFNSFLSEGKLLESIVKDFGIVSKGITKYDRINALNQFLLETLSKGENAVLIIDEAQNLSIKVLEQIRMLSNLETEKEKMLQVVFLGQLELDEKLRSPQLKQLNQRISIRYRLLPLNQKETENYIYQRLNIAGSNGNLIFSRSAIEEIYRITQGIPRLINLLCDRSLIAGYIQGSFTIDKDLVKRAEKELQGNQPPIAIVKPMRPWRIFSSLKFSWRTLLLFLLTIFIILNLSGISWLNWAKEFSHKSFEQIIFYLSSKSYISKIPFIYDESNKIKREIYPEKPE